MVTRHPGKPTSGRYVYKVKSGQWYWQCDLHDISVASWHTWPTQQEALDSALIHAGHCTERITMSDQLHARLAENQTIIRARHGSREQWQDFAIAAAAEWPRANAALRKVLGLHRRDSVFRDTCAECSDYGTDEVPSGQMIEWPCPTVKTIQEAMQ